MHQFRTRYRRPKTPFQCWIPPAPSSQMSKRSDPAAFARAAGAADSATLADPAPAPDPAPPASAALAMPEDEAEDLSPVLQPYDPAEYRWVPVRRKPRLDGWTEEKQRRFI